MQNRQNPDAGLTKKDVAIVGGLTTLSTVAGVGGTLGIGAIISSASIGAAFGAAGGPLGLVIGGLVGGLVGFLVAKYRRDKLRREEERRLREAQDQQREAHDQQREAQDQQREARLRELETEKNRQQALTTQHLRTIDLLTFQNQTLIMQIQILQAQLQEQSARMARMEEAIIRLGARHTDFQLAPDEEKRRREETNRISQEQIPVLMQLKKCVEDSLSLEDMKDPVTADDGNLYDRSTLQKHYDVCKSEGRIPRCPLRLDITLSNPADLKPSDHAINALRFLRTYFQDNPAFREALSREAEAITSDPEISRVLLGPVASATSSSSSASSATVIHRRLSAPSVDQLSPSPSPAGYTTVSTHSLETEDDDENEQSSLLGVSDSKKSTSRQPLHRSSLLSLRSSSSSSSSMLFPPSPYSPGPRHDSAAVDLTLISSAQGKKPKAQGK